MEQFEIKQDIPIFYVEAESFPEGIERSHQALRGLLDHTVSRRYFGVSRPNSHGIIEYKAAAEELQAGEGRNFHCKTMILKKGTYYSIYLENYIQRPESIGEAFALILLQPDLDPRGYCVEMFDGPENIRCLVRQKEK